MRIRFISAVVVDRLLVVISVRRCEDLLVAYLYSVSEGQSQPQGTAALILDMLFPLLGTPQDGDDPPPPPYPPTPILSLQEINSVPGFIEKDPSTSAQWA